MGKNFFVKLYSCKIFSYVFCVQKYFCNKKSAFCFSTMAIVSSWM